MKREREKVYEEQAFKKYHQMKLGELSLLDHHQIHNHDRILETSTSSSSSTRPLLFVCGKNEYCQLLLCSSSSSSSEVISCFTTPQLSDPMLEKVIDDLVEIANGDRHTLFLTKSGQVFGIGSNQQGNIFIMISRILVAILKFIMKNMFHS